MMELGIPHLSQQEVRAVLAPKAAVQQPRRRVIDTTACRECGATVLDDGSFYECHSCGDTNLVSDVAMRGVQPTKMRWHGLKEAA